MNHRMGERLQISQAVRVDFPGSGSLEGHLKDISLSGAAVISSQAKLLERYAPVTLSLELGDGLEPAIVSAKGCVVRLDGALIGIMFMHEMIELLQRLHPDSELMEQQARAQRAYGSRY